MNISVTIREQRKKLSLSQEELGEKIYVTRQTISNWENDKSYPDINSIILLSQVFDLTIDSMVKGDLEIMEQRIEKDDIKANNRYIILMVACIGITLVMFTISIFYRFIPGLIVAALAFVISMFFAIKADKIQKKYDVYTYREIVAFIKGETLDEISKIRESGKRSYQTILVIAGSGAIVLITILVHLVLRIV